MPPVSHFFHSGPPSSFFYLPIVQLPIHQWINPLIRSAPSWCNHLKSWPLKIVLGTKTSTHEDTSYPNHSKDIRMDTEITRLSLGATNASKWREVTTRRVNWQIWGEGKGGKDIWHKSQDFTLANREMMARKQGGLPKHQILGRWEIKQVTTTGSSEKGCPKGRCI
jgi:hypothetical protein